MLLNEDNYVGFTRYLSVYQWAHCHRQSFHNQVDTNNITKYFNNVLCRQYLPLHHNSTVSALVQILIEFAFPELEKQLPISCAYQKPCYEMPFILRGKTKLSINLLHAHIGRAQLITKSDKREVRRRVFDIKSAGTNVWSTDVASWTCTCPAFVLSHTPCKHFFAVFHHLDTTSSCVPVTTSNRQELPGKREKTLQL